MKKIIFPPLITILTLFLALVAFNSIIPIPPATSYTEINVHTPEMAAAKQILGTKCIMCHSKNPTLPFYAEIPGAGGFIKKHVKEGTGMMNLQELLAGTSTDRWAYDRLEHVITNNTMPIKSYLSLHWNGKLTEQEQNEILSWIAQRRAEIK
jgi:cytochrome c peroxidase